MVRLMCNTFAVMLVVSVCFVQVVMHIGLDISLCFI